MRERERERELCSLLDLGDRMRTPFLGLKLSCSLFYEHETEAEMILHKQPKMSNCKITHSQHGADRLERRAACGERGRARDDFGDLVELKLV